MPIIVDTAPQQEFTTTVANIMACASQEVRGVLNPNLGATQTQDAQILLDYTNRVSLEILRFSRFTFLLSAPVSFTTVGTQTGATTFNNQYWLGPTGENPFGTIDAGLNLVDLDIIKKDTVIDYTNFKRLANSELEPVDREFTVPGRPRIWQVLSSNPQVMVLWPPPDRSDTGFSPPGADAGYEISFRYYKSRIQLVSSGQILQIPSRYEDIVCNGVTAYAMRYLKETEGFQMYNELYTAGKTQIIKDMNLFPRAEEFIHPDATAVTRQLNTGVGLDSGIETSIP